MKWRSVKIFRNESGGVSLIDILLVLVVLLCIGFIVWYFSFRKLNKMTPQGAVPVVKKQTAEISKSSPDSPPFWGIRGNKWQKFLASGKVITNWETVGNLASISSDQTSACASDSVEQHKAIGLSVESLAKALQKSQIDYFIEPAGRRCFVRGQILDVLLFGDEAQSPYVSYLGSLKIEAIYPLQSEATSAVFLELAGLNPTDFFEQTKTIRNFLKGASAPATLLRLKPAEFKRPIVPLSHFIHSRLSSLKINEFLNQNKKLSVIDLREENEVAETLIEQSMRLPYHVPSGDSKFSWSATNLEVGTHKFDIVSLEKQFKLLNNFPIVLVGTDSADGRPIWALNALTKVGFSNVYWYADGAVSLKEAIQSANVELVK